MIVYKSSASRDVSWQDSSCNSVIYPLLYPLAQPVVFEGLWTPQLNQMIQNSCTYLDTSRENVVKKKTSVEKSVLEGLPGRTSHMRRCLWIMFILLSGTICTHALHKLSLYTFKSKFSPWILLFTLLTFWSLKFVKVNNMNTPISNLK